MTATNFEVMLNPYCYYESEPSHVARFILDGRVYLCGWNTELNLPILDHDKSVIKMANEKGYDLPKWVEIPKWIQDI